MQPQGHPAHRIDNVAQRLDKLTIVQIAERFDSGADAPKFFTRLLIDSQILGKLVSMLFQPFAECLVNRAVAPRRTGHTVHERGRRQRAAYGRQLLHGQFHFASQPQTLRETQFLLALGHLVAVDANDHFHGHQRPEILFEPFVVGQNPRLGREELHQLDRRIDPESPDGKKDHDCDTTGRHQAVVANDLTADPVPHMVEDGMLLPPSLLRVLILAFDLLGKCARWPK